MEKAGQQDDDKVECVGSLLVHSTDVQELSQMKEASMKDKVECVGSLLVHSTDMQELMMEDQAAKQAEDMTDSPSLVRRITKQLQGPAPDDAEVETWAD